MSGKENAEMWFSAARRRYGNINTGVALFVKNVKSVPWVSET